MLVSNNPDHKDWPHNTDDNRFVTPLTTGKFQQGDLKEWYPRTEDRNEDRWIQPTDIQGVKTLILADGNQKPMGLPVKTNYSAAADFIYVDFPAVLTPEVGLLKPERNKMAWLGFRAYMDNEHKTLFYDASGTELTAQHISGTDLDIKNTMLFTREYSRDKGGNITGHQFVPAGGMLDVMTRVTDAEQKDTGRYGGRRSPTKFFSYVFGSEYDPISQDPQLQRFVFGRNTGEAMFVDEYEVNSPLATSYIKSVKDRSPEYSRGRLLDSGAYWYGEDDEGFKSQAMWMARNNPEMMATIVTWRGKDDLNSQLDVLRQSGYFNENYNLVLMGHAADEGFVKIANQKEHMTGGAKVLTTTNTPAYGGESIAILKEAFENVNGLSMLSNIALASCDMSGQGPSCQYLAEEFRADVYSQSNSWGTGHTKPGAGKNLISNIFVAGEDVSVHQPTYYSGSETFSNPDHWNKMTSKQRKGSNRNRYGGKFKADWMPINTGTVNRGAILDALKDLEDGTVF